MAARHGCWNLGGARKSAHRRTGLQGVSEPNQDEETAQEDHPVVEHPSRIRKAPVHDAAQHITFNLHDHLQESYYYTHFTNEETGAQRGKNLYRITYLRVGMNSGHQIWSLLLKHHDIALRSSITNWLHGILGLNV